MSNKHLKNGIKILFTILFEWQFQSFDYLKVYL